jgi:hypothetical protein
LNRGLQEPHDVVHFLLHHQISISNSKWDVLAWFMQELKYWYICVQVSETSLIWRRCSKLSWLSGFLNDESLEINLKDIILLLEIFLHSNLFFNFVHIDRFYYYFITYLIKITYAIDMCIQQVWTFKHLQWMIILQNTRKATVCCHLKPALTKYSIVCILSNGILNLLLKEGQKKQFLFSTIFLALT